MKRRDPNRSPSIRSLRLARGSRRRGFSLIEIVMVLAVTSTLVALVLPWARRNLATAELTSATRVMMAHIAKARSLAAAGTLPDFQGSLPSGWTTTDRIVSAGIQILSPSQYVVFVDKDYDDTQVVAVQVVDLAVDHPGSNLQITSGSTVRFKRNGTLHQVAAEDLNFVLRDVETGRERMMQVSWAGRARIVQ